MATPLASQSLIEVLEIRTSDEDPVYVGEVQDGVPNGQGTWTHPNGDKYVGTWKGGKMNGQGTYTFSDGEKKPGYYMNGEYVPELCQDMGLTKGTEAFGNCVLKLIDEITRDD